MEWIIQQGGIPTAAAYGDTYTRREQVIPTASSGPVSTGADGITYSGNNPTTNYPCKQNIPAAVQLNDGAFHQFSTEQDMASHLCSTGSLSIVVSTEGWDGYKGGIMSASTCGSHIDHAVLLVGATIGSDATGTQYWKVQNSWGDDWGEEGFIRLSYGENTCLITTQAVAPAQVTATTQLLAAKAYTDSDSVSGLHELSTENIPEDQDNESSSGSGLGTNAIIWICAAAFFVVAAVGLVVWRVNTGAGFDEPEMVNGAGLNERLYTEMNVDPL